MKKIYRFKHYLLYSPYISILLVLSPAFLILIDYFCDSFEIITKSNIDYKLIGIFIGYLVFYLNFRNNSFRNLFKIISEFNRRYDSINNDIYELNESNIDKTKIFDYFNLCSEEYYFYSHGMIPHDVWMNWKVGMSEYFNKEHVKSVAEEEFLNKDDQSYYGFNPYNLNIINSSV